MKIFLVACFFAGFAVAMFVMETIAFYYGCLA